MALAFIFRCYIILLIFDGIKALLFCNIHIKTYFFLNLSVYDERSGLVNAQKGLTHELKRKKTSLSFLKENLLITVPIVIH